MRTFIAVVVATGIAIGLTSTGSGAIETPARSLTPASLAPTSLAATHVTRSAPYVPPALTWRECEDPTLDRFGAECAKLVVPLDYADPSGTKIRVAVSRVLHTTPAADYQGIMLVNPGGPGGSGLIYSIFQTFVPNGAGAAYDWIGFDPRGVGSSRPALACDAKVFQGGRPPYRPTRPAILKKWVQRSKAYARDCAQSRRSELFAHVKTRDSVKDMESLRIALGQEQINFYGFSYGTYLGSVYATQHPDRVRRFVFDGTVNPDRVFYQANQDQDRAFQRTFSAYFSWLAKHRGAYHVGSTRHQVRIRYLRAIARLDRKAAGGVLGGDELTDVFTAAGYGVYSWDTIADAWSRYLNKGKADQLIVRYQEANDLTPGGDNGYAMYLGTQCTDAAWPRNQARLNRDNRRLDQRFDYLTWANAWFNGPCAYWKYSHGRPVKVDGSAITTPILMISETYDAATPFAGSLRVRQLFPTASLIEGRNGTTHAGSLSGVACTDNAIARYLTNGTVPTRLSGRRSDKLCRPVPKPAATATAARTVTGPRAVLRDRLRAGFEAAQLRRTH
jgi:pimeloyl-ACP methyl ester carboxylesterase